MTERSGTPSDADLLAAAEHNGFAQIKAFGAWRRADVHDGPDMLRVLSDVPDSAFNMVVRADLTGATDEGIASVQHEAAARGVPLAWLVGPASRPLDLGACLARHGFRREEDALAMTLDLTGLEPPATADKVASRTATDREALEVEALALDAAADETLKTESLSAWARIVTAGFALPPFTEEPMRELADAMLRQPSSRFRAFVVRRGGEAVGAASLFVANRVAGIYNVATLEHARGHGVATAATLAALRGARDAGCSLAVLQAGPAAAALYHRVGFRVRGRIEAFAWDPATPS